MVERNTGRFFDSPGGLIEHVAIDHEDVARDERDLPAVLILDNEGACTQLAFLTVAFPGPIPPPITIVSSAMRFRAAAPAFKSPAAIAEFASQRQQPSVKSQMKYFISINR